MTEKRFVIDSWAWIEYLDGSAAGEKVKSYVENKNNIVFTSSLSVAEIVSKFLRRDMDPRVAVDAIKSLSRVLDINMEISAFAGELHAEIRKKISDFGLADAFVLACSKTQKAKIITGDPHFKNFPEAILVTR